VRLTLTGGSVGESNYTTSVEVYSTNHELINLEMEDFPYPVISPVALWVKGRILVCGGKRTNRIEIFLNYCVLINLQVTILTTTPTRADAGNTLLATTPGNRVKA
jgi:hypothetical protein